MAYRGRFNSEIKCELCSGREWEGSRSPWQMEPPAGQDLCRGGSVAVRKTNTSNICECYALTCDLRFIRTSVKIFRWRGSQRWEVERYQSAQAFHTAGLGDPVAAIWMGNADVLTVFCFSIFNVLYGSVHCFQRVVKVNAVLPAYNATGKVVNLCGK